MGRSWNGLKLLFCVSGRWNYRNIFLFGNDREDGGNTIINTVRILIFNQSIMPKTTSTIILMAIAILSLPSVAHSQPKESHGIGVNGSIGTLGIGVNLNKSITSQLGARLGVNFGSVGANQSNSGVDYNANLDLGSAQLLADFYPFGGGLRLTGGLMYQNNRLSVTSKPTNSNSYTINNTQYSAADVGALKGEFQYGNSIAP
jgi:hypothetical protein